MAVTVTVLITLLTSYISSVIVFLCNYPEA
jgi:hypothetical protein